MNRILGILVLAGVLVGTVIAVAAPNFTGEYSDKSFLGGQAVFQMSVERSREFREALV